MAKKPPSIVEAAKALPTTRNGTIGFRDRLSEEQRNEFDELLEWFRGTPAHNRPTMTSLRSLMEERLGAAPSESVFRRYVNGK